MRGRLNDRLDWLATLDKERRKEAGPDVPGEDGGLPRFIAGAVQVLAVPRAPAHKKD
jgi:hypothetical protein